MRATFFILAVLALAQPCAAQMPLTGVGPSGLGAVGPSYVLDGLSVQPQMAFSSQKLKGTATFAEQLTNDGGTTRQDIGFDGSGNYDIAAMHAFCGAAAHCARVKWYDQSGNGNDCSYNSMRPDVRTGGTDQALNGIPSAHILGGGTAECSTSVSSKPATNLVIVAVVKPDNLSADAFYKGDNAAAGSAGIDLRYYAASGQVNAVSASVGSIATSKAGVSTSTGSTVTFNWTVSSGAWNYRFNGSVDSSGTQTLAVNAGSNTNLNGGNGQAGVVGFSPAVIIWQDFSPSAGDISAVENAFRTAWGTP
jgi:hypothetical protein